MHPTSLLEAVLLLITATIQCCSLVLALVTAVQCYSLVLALVTAVQWRLRAAWNATEAEDHLMPPPFTAGVEHSRARFMRPVQETQTVGGLGVAQESLDQRNLPAVMVAGIRFKVSYSI